MSNLAIVFWIIYASVGKPYFENVQYNSPIEIYDDDTVDEMVKIMNNAGAAVLGQQQQQQPQQQNKNDETIRYGWE